LKPQILVNHNTEMENMNDKTLNEHFWEQAKCYHKYGVHKTLLEAWQAEFRIWFKSELQKLSKEINERSN
jgi:hypothetical protein